MSILTGAWLALIELWRRRLAILPIAVAVTLGFVLTGRLEGLGGVQGTHMLLVSVHWMIATQLLPTLGELVGILAGAPAIANEIERGTVTLLAVKVPRWEIVAGKLLGVYAFLLASFGLWAAVLGVLWAVGGVDGVGQLLAATMLGALPGLLVASIALAYSARLGAQTALVATVLTLMARGVASSLLQVHVLADRPGAEAVAKAISFLVPSDRLGEIPALLSNGQALSHAQLYALGMPLAWLALAMALFHLRDLSDRV